MSEFKIFLGPAGIPTVSKKKSTIEGIKTVKEIGLNAMEVEFVRGVRMSDEMARQAGEVAKKLGIKLSVHAPYFINLLSEKEETVEASKKRILESMKKAEIMGADVVVVHTGYLGNLSIDEARERVVEIYKEIIKEAKEEKIKNVKIAAETMEKTSQFGDLEDIVYVCKKLKGKIVPLIDFAHLYGRNNGKINYEEVFEKIKPLKLKEINSHFSNLKYNINTKRFQDIHIPINSHPPFKPLAKEILKRKITITIISESPILEQDSLKMKKIFEELGYKF